MRSLYLRILLLALCVLAYHVGGAQGVTTSSMTGIVRDTKAQALP